jgi:RNA polymerase sigma-70 factor (ECF subfamily)
MMKTPVSLLERLRQPDAQAAWERFVHLYTPLLQRWARRLGLPEHDAADLIQDVLVLLVQKLPEFTYNGHQSFRGWLYTVTRNRWRDLQRRQVPEPRSTNDPTFRDVADPDPVEVLSEEEYRNYLVQRALRLMQTDFQPTTWKACWEHVVAGKSAAVVAAELNVTPAVVYVATSRVLSRLRQELEGLLD